MATIILPTNGQTGWGSILSIAITAINAQLETLVPSGNSLIRATTSSGAMTDLTYSQSSATANTIVQRGTNGVVVVGTPTASSHAATKAYVDANGGGSVSADSITDATTVGKDVLRATDAATARSAIGAAADDSVVRLADAQTISGTKSFSNPPVVPDNSFSVSKTNGLQAALDEKIGSSNATINNFVAVSVLPSVGAAKTVYLKPAAV